MAFGAVFSFLEKDRQKKLEPVGLQFFTLQGYVWQARISGGVAR